MEIQTLAIGIIFIIIFYIIKRPRIGPNEPPLVPYSIPILGHTYSYLFDSKNFIKKCREQYGECFSIYIFGGVTTVVSGNSMNEVFKSHNDFDLPLAARETVPFHKIFTYNGGLTKENIDFHVKTARDQVSGKLETHVPTVQKYLVKGIEKWIGDCDVPREFNNAWFLVNNLIALSGASIFVGEEAASHEDLVKSFGDLAFDIGPLAAIPPIFSFIHKKAHEFIITLPIRFGWNPASRHREIVMNRLKPVIEKRLKERIELGDNYKPYEDLLEFYINQPNYDYNNLPHLVDDLFLVIFAAFITTSKAAANALYDLAGRPECLNELYEEALAINKECNGLLTLSDVRKMKKLNSFVKESLRHSDDILGITQYMISKKFTFSNGLVIPKMRMIALYVEDSLKSKEFFGDDAEGFKPFRFANSDCSATKVDRTFVVFGGGRHACPGRFFAVNEIVLILHNLILKYNISTKSGKVENKMAFGPMAMPPRGTIVFEKK